MTPDARRCPVCGARMAPLTVKGTPRKTCSLKCGAKYRGTRTLSSAATERRYVAEEVVHLLDLGASPAAIVRALNTNPIALSRRLYRAGRPDLAKPFERIRHHSKRAAA